MDLKSYSRWHDYTRARDEMFATTDTAWAPWYVALSDDKQKLRLNVLSHILSRIPYKSTKAEKIKLPKRDKASGYKSPDLPLRSVPEAKISNNKK
jgi:polyphosphate kinase